MNALVAPIRAMAERQKLKLQPKKRPASKVQTPVDTLINTLFGLVHCKLNHPRQQNYLCPQAWGGCTSSYGYFFATFST